MSIESIITLLSSITNLILNIILSLVPFLLMLTSQLNSNSPVSITFSTIISEYSTNSTELPLTDELYNFLGNPKSLLTSSNPSGYDSSGLFSHLLTFSICEIVLGCLIIFSLTLSINFSITSPIILISFSLAPIIVVLLPSLLNITVLGELVIELRTLITST